MSPPYGQAYGSSGLPESVLEGRRAVCWWWYCQPRSGSRSGLPRARAQGYRGVVGAPHAAWTIRVSRPRRSYALSMGKQGCKTRKVHRVRDQLIGIHKTRGEVVRLTRYLCGATSWQVELRADADTVCVDCEVRHARIAVVRPGRLVRAR